MAKLTAFYPDSSLEPENIEAYISVIEEWRSVSSIDRAIHNLIMSNPKFPAISELREAYVAAFKQEQYEMSESRGLPVGDDYRSPPPPEWIELGKRLGAVTKPIPE